jgi:hypothetical protein
MLTSALFAASTASGYSLAIPMPYRSVENGVPAAFSDFFPLDVTQASSG